MFTSNAYIIFIMFHLFCELSVFLFSICFLFFFFSSIVEFDRLLAIYTTDTCSHKCIRIAIEVNCYNLCSDCRRHIKLCSHNRRNKYFKIIEAKTEFTSFSMIFSTFIIRSCFSISSFFFLFSHLFYYSAQIIFEFDFSALIKR